MALANKTGSERDRRRSWLRSALFDLALPAAFALAAVGPDGVRGDDGERVPRDGERSDAEHARGHDGEHRGGDVDSLHKPSKSNRRDDRRHDDVFKAQDGDGLPGGRLSRSHDGPGRVGALHPEKVIGDVDVDVRVDVGINVIVNSSDVAVGLSHGAQKTKPVRPHGQPALDHDRPTARPQRPNPEQTIYELEETVRRLQEELEMARRPRDSERRQSDGSQRSPREMQDRLEQLRREMQRHAEELQDRFRRQMEERRGQGRGDEPGRRGRHDGERREDEQRREGDGRWNREEAVERDRAESQSRLPRYQAFFDSLQNFDF